MNVRSGSQANVRLCFSDVNQIERPVSASRRICKLVLQACRHLYQVILQPSSHQLASGAMIKGTDKIGPG